MKSKLYGELHQFLVQERISLDTKIVNYIVYQLADIQVTEKQLAQGFSFREEWGIREEEKEKITFSVPEKFSLPQIRKLMEFFSLLEKDYHHKEPLLLDNQYIFAQFLPKFKQYFQELKERSPDIIAKYRIASAPILESTAQNTLRECIEDTKKIVLSDSLKELTETMKSLVDFILLLSGRMNTLNRFPLFYKDIIKSSDKIEELLQLQEIKDHKEINFKLNMLLKGIKLYALYQRNESVLGNIALHEEIKKFLVPYRITTAKCDILEHMVLALADATMRSESPCRFDQGNDLARLIITFSDIDAVNVKKIIDYMRHLGDETTCEGYGSRQYGSVLREEREECAFEEVELHAGARIVSGTVKSTKLHESHTIEIDGKFFYDIVLPKIKEKITEMATLDLLAKYQELSKEHFKPKEIAKVSDVSIFSKPQPAADEVVQDPAPALAKI